MKSLVFKIFYKTFGLVVRAIQRTLIRPSPYRPKDPVMIINEEAMQDSANYGIKNFSHAIQFRSFESFWIYCLGKSSSLNSEVSNSIKGKNFLGTGIIAEFGVFEGKSINFFATKCPNARVFGFDSFLGLEEDWGGWILSKGHFSTNGVLPKCASNVKLNKGWFVDTVPIFKNELQDEVISFLHIDSDTYKPAKYVLNALADNLKRGSIIVFDEYFGYTGWRLHEFKAFQEFVLEHNVEYKYIAYTGEQVAVEIL
jgi:hypothetical protein